MLKKRPRTKLIDDTDFLIQRVKEHEPKPDAWFRSADHLAWIRKLPCVLAHTRLCKGEVQAAHLRIGTDAAGGVKPSDVFVSPQCEFHHRLSHVTGERSLWSQVTVDPVEFILLRYALRSPCTKTKIAAKAEYERRYGA